MPDRKQYRVAIIGATGFTGSELVRLLHGHPAVEITAITSESHRGKPFSAVHPQFTGIEDRLLIPVEELNEKETDLVFLALPHGVSMDFVKRFSSAPFRIVDLSGDFRLRSKAVYETWYGMDHRYPEGIVQAVYGIPERFREAIAGARLVANPGCYPTGAIIGVAPLLEAGLVAPAPIIIDAKSGVTGSGVKAKPVNHFSNVNDNFRAYGLKKHRHTIEIQETLDRFSERETGVQFTPHLLPVDRGILSTIYLQPAKQLREDLLRSTLEAAYRREPFVRIRSAPPSIKDVRGTNYCDLYITFDERTNTVILITVIDNLVKGAAGQAIQNMNIMLQLPENAGLNQIPVAP